MARIVDHPILLPPVNSTEATLRIKEAMPDMGTTFRVITHIPPDDIVARMKAGEDVAPLLTYEACSLDATKHVENISTGAEGLPLRPGTSPGDWSDPFTWDTYKHDPGELEYLGVGGDYTEPRKKRASKAERTEAEAYAPIPAHEVYNPHRGPIKPAVQVPEDVKARIKSRLDAIDPDIEPTAFVKEFEERSGAKIAATERVDIAPHDRTDAEIAATFARERRHTNIGRAYEPMKSGVWIAAGVNEDDIVELHPDASRDPQAFFNKVLGKTKDAAIEDPRDSAVKALTAAVEKLTKLVQGL